MCLGGGVECPLPKPTLRQPLPEEPPWALQCLSVVCDRSKIRARFFALEP